MSKVIIYMIYASETWRIFIKANLVIEEEPI